MEEIKCTPLLEFYPNQLNEVRKQYGYDNANDINKAIDALEDWITKQSHFDVKKFERSYLERLIISSKGSLERTKKHLDKLCTSRTLMPEFLRNFKIKTEFNKFLSLGYNCLVPKPTSELNRLCITKIHSENYDNFSLLEFYRYMFMMVDYILLNDYVNGTEFIVDIAHINMGLISKINPIVIQKGSSIIIDCYGIRLKSIYIINSSKLVESLVSLIKQGLSEKLRNRLHVLSTPDSLLKYYGKDVLPSDYGGNERSLAELHELTFKEFSSDLNLKRMEEMERATTNESFRDTRKYNEDILGMPGSFKALNVD